MAQRAGITTDGRLAHVLKDAIEWECRQSVQHYAAGTQYTRRPAPWRERPRSKAWAHDTRRLAA
jgi:hypothetical protein